MPINTQWRRRFALVAASTALATPFLANGVANAATRTLSNGPNIVSGIKQHGAGTQVQMLQVKSIPNPQVTSVDIYMTIGPRENPGAISPTKFNQRVNDFPDIIAFNGWAAGNRIDIRGNHYYAATVSGLS